jgi:hypothetical protein
MVSSMEINPPKILMASFKALYNLTKGEFLHKLSSKLLKAGKIRSFCSTKTAHSANRSILMLEPTHPTTIDPTLTPTSSTCLAINVLTLQSSIPLFPIVQNLVRKILATLMQ